MHPMQRHMQSPPTLQELLKRPTLTIDECIDWLRAGGYPRDRLIALLLQNSRTRIPEIELLRLLRRSEGIVFPDDPDPTKPAPTPEPTLDNGASVDAADLIPYTPVQAPEPIKPPTEDLKTKRARALGVLD